MTTTTALASRDAAFAKALDDLTRERSNALSLHTMKERARNPAIGDGYIVACERAKAKYHAARALAQECYLDNDTL